jgi:hypothetical protein
MIGSFVETALRRPEFKIGGLEVISKMQFLSPMSFPLVLSGNPDFAQNSPIDSTVHVWIPDRYIRE